MKKTTASKVLIFVSMFFFALSLLGPGWLAMSLAAIYFAILAFHFEK
jgi:hypothetical protein